MKFLHSLVFWGFLAWTWPAFPGHCHTIVSGESESKSNLALTVEPQKKEFQFGEAVSVVLELRNQGSLPILVNRSFVPGYYLRIEIAGPSNSKVPWCGRIITRSQSPDEFVILAPGASVRATRVISCERNVRGFLITNPGEYIVHVSYRLIEPIDSLRKLAKGAQIVKGPIYAPSVKVQVLPAKPAT